MLPGKPYCKQHDPKTLAMRVSAARAGGIAKHYRRKAADITYELRTEDAILSAVERAAKDVHCGAIPPTAAKAIKDLCGLAFEVVKSLHEDKVSDDYLATLTNDELKGLIGDNAGQD